jgi:hypothetical protein
MAPPQDETPRSWRFTCPLAYLLVDSKQVANGEVCLVLKCDAAQSPALASRQVSRPTANGHTLMVYVSKETKSRVHGSLHAFPGPEQRLSNPHVR